MPWKQKLLPQLFWFLSILYSFIEGQRILFNFSLDNTAIKGKEDHLFITIT